MPPRRFIIHNLPEFFIKANCFASTGGPIWYRGQGCYDNDLKPSAYRNTHFLKDAAPHEQRSINMAKSELLDNPGVGKFLYDLEWLCYLQHTGSPTRLLDFSYKPSVALYFAFEKFIKGEDTDTNCLPCVWILKLGQFSSEMKKLLKFRRLDFLNIRKERLIIRNRTEQKLYEFFDNSPRSLHEVIQFEGENKSRRNKFNQVHIPFLSPPVHSRPKAQGSCFIRFPIFDQKHEKKYEQFWLDRYIFSSSTFDSLGQFIFLNPQRTAEELRVFNFDPRYIYPDEISVVKSIGREVFPR